MPDIPLATKHTVVSMAARGRRMADIVDRTGLPVANVRAIAEEYGAPDLGKLAQSADELRRQVDRQVQRDHVPGKAQTAGGVTATMGLALLLAEAERIESPRLISRAKDLAARLDTLRTDLAAAVKVHAEKSEKSAKLARLAELRAEEAKIRAELRGPAKPAAKPRKRTAPKAKSESAVIREWAAVAGVECPAYGRIPQRVLDAYAARDAA